MRRDEALRLLAEHREELAGMGVESLGLFGSVARDQAGGGSDVDLLVEVRRGTGLFGFVGVQQRLEEIFATSVDLVERDSIKPRLRERILGEEVPVLEAAADGRLAVVATAERLAGASDRSGGSGMAEPDWKVRIEDILQAIDEIQQFTEGMTFETFVADRRTVLAVNHSFALIGEAERHIPPDVEARYPAVPWAEMRGMRNVLIHRYRDVNLAIVWDTARNFLLPLVPRLREMLERET